MIFFVIPGLWSALASISPKYNEPIRSLFLRDENRYRRFLSHSIHTARFIRIVWIIVWYNFMLTVECQRQKTLFTSAIIIVATVNFKILKQIFGNGLAIKEAASPFRLINGRKMIACLSNHHHHLIFKSNVAHFGACQAE